MVAVGALGQDVKIPKCLQGHAGGENHDDGEDIVSDHDGHERVGGAADPGDIPDSDV